VSLKPAVSVVRRIAEIGRHFWDWADNRLIVEKLIALVVVASTVRVTEWCFAYADRHPDSAAMVAAVTAPQMLVCGAAVAFLFKRTGQ